jgi:hypothetical protein
LVAELVMPTAVRTASATPIAAASAAEIIVPTIALSLRSDLDRTITAKDTN